MLRFAVGRVGVEIDGRLSVEGAWSLLRRLCEADPAAVAAELSRAGLAPERIRLVAAQMELLELPRPIRSLANCPGVPVGCRWTRDPLPALLGRHRALRQIAEIEKQREALAG